MNKPLPNCIVRISNGYAAIRKHKDTYVAFLARPLHRLGVHPNTLTAIGFVSALCSVYFLFEHHVLFVAFYLLNYLLDILDGTLARIGNYHNPNGKYIDAVSDALFGMLLLVKSYVYFDSVLILIPLCVYVWEASRLKHWAPGFYPNIFWLKFFFVFRLFSFGIIFQLCVSVFNILMRKIFALRYES